MDDPHERRSPSVGRHRRTGRGRSGAFRAALSATVAGISVAALGSAVAAPSTPVAARTLAGQAAPSAPVATPTSNPLQGRTWGVYKGPGDQAWEPYLHSSGSTRTLLAKIALRPKAKWFGSWISNATIQQKVQKYIASSTGGDPDVLVQMTVFRMVPWEHEACRRLPTTAEQASYRQWIDRFALGIGSAHVALVLQPDGPFALCVPNGSSLPSRLIAYSAKRFSSLPNTSVYIDGGASDWPKDDPALAARFLVPDGVRYARGFALNSTHYATTPAEIDFGSRLVEELARRGAPGKHFVINTSSNGRGFDFGEARGSHPDNANVCRSRTETHCVTLGIPPTSDVTNPRWGLSSPDRTRAAKHVDGYLWFGRPWLFMQADPFDLGRALALVRSTPY